MSNLSDAYCIHSTNTGGRKLLWMWQFTNNPPKFHYKFLSELICCAKQQSYQCFSAKMLLGCNVPKFSMAKVLGYIVSRFNMPKFYHVKVYLHMHCNTGSLHVLRFCNEAFIHHRLILLLISVMCKYASHICTYILMHAHMHSICTHVAT